jgi:hypothetical protein
MAGTYDVELVTKAGEIRANMRTFSRGLNANHALVKDLMGRTDYWVVDEELNGFGPSKFVGVKGMTFDRYHALRARSSLRKKAGVTDRPRFDGEARLAIAQVVGCEFTESSPHRTRLAEWAAEKLGSPKIRKYSYFVSLPLGNQGGATLKSQMIATTPSQAADSESPDPGIEVPNNMREKALLEDAYLRFTSDQLQEIIPHHNRLSSRFREWLDSAKARGIVAESDAVDVACAHFGQFCLFELKTCRGQSTRHALRESLGQIIEYGFYPGRDEPDQLGIVLDAEPTSADITLFRRLAGIVARPVELFWEKDGDFHSPRLTDHPLALHARLP